MLISSLVQHKVLFQLIKDDLLQNDIVGPQFLWTIIPYVHLMTEMNADATVKAKQAFEHISVEHNLKIQHYHADNGLFDKQEFKLSIRKGGQSLSFCGVNAHHQNGKAKNRIKDIMTGPRMALLHASH